jgi:two-component system, cell cycle sensor histidine kinase and response regulator CckA
VLQAKILDLNEVVRGLEMLLRRLIGEDIRLAIRMDRDLGQVRADSGQLEQVILNLAVNARDAMPQGGRFLIETRNVELAPDDVQVRPEATPGPHVMLAVSDTGCGMDRETITRVFEPFFTTKETGKGTGLGLATVYGIVQQSGGYITVESRPGRGTTFRIYLPRVDEPVESTGPGRSGKGHRGSETILLVEDEPMVRHLVRDVLRTSGYTVLEARHAEEALRLAGRHAGPIDLLVSDVVMPGMSGSALAESLTAVRPNTKVSLHVRLHRRRRHPLRHPRRRALLYLQAVRPPRPHPEGPGAPPSALTVLLRPLAAVRPRHYSLLPRTGRGHVPYHPDGLIGALAPACHCVSVPRW